LQSGALSYQRLFGEMGLDWQIEQQQQAEALGLDLAAYRGLLVQKLFGSAASVADPNGVDPLAAQRGKRRRIKRSHRMGV